MIIGTTLIAASENREHFTPWFPRGADNAVFAYELIYSDLSGDPMEVTIYHKDGEDPGSQVSTPTGGFAQFGGTDFYQANATGLKELIRFKVTVPQGDPGQSVVFRFLAPTWYSKA